MYNISVRRATETDYGLVSKNGKVQKNKWVYSESRKRWRLDYEIHIEAEDSLVSKVKNPNSFVVI